MSASRPAVKRQYGARKSATCTPSAAAASPSKSRRTLSSAPASSPPRSRLHQPAAPSSDWSDAVKETFSSPAPVRVEMTSGASSSLEGRSTPPTTQEDEPTSSSGAGRRVLRERKTPTKPPSAPKGDLRSFFQRTSPRKRRRVSCPFAEESDEEQGSEAMARTSSSGSSASSASASSTSTRTSLSSVSSSSSSSSSRASHKHPPKLEQLYLDPFRSAGHATLSCATCALSYARTPEDLAFHARHHKKVVGGCDWVAGDEARGVTVLDDAADWGDKAGGKVLMVDYPSTDATLRRKLKDVLETIDTELSSTALTPEQLALSKVFLFVTPQRKVIAAAVVQRISTAFQIVVEEGKPGKQVKEVEAKASKDLLRFGEDEGAIFCSPTPLPTLLGIQRIWTSTSSRRHGLASLLLDFAAGRYVYGSPIPRERRAADFAFSQPTGKGQKLARAWTGTKGFKVFVD
ncbi:ESCO1/2 acetyl-transferase-domain-containing protein [Rhodotorula diobovata]|uniref:ESCO1/2 acetyl-transferase-domain-containing protein n=1 Tax=Rhodotorula diobovata TaxID=5288 RepID=A0A5C5FS90_9BASI|nr:ESCO1/2 acetyl-transferase-domain-containing protein [Rhodotorula diobovata]